jgi:hypothetical protein
VNLGPPLVLPDAIPAIDYRSAIDECAIDEMPRLDEIRAIVALGAAKRPMQLP